MDYQTVKANVVPDMPTCIRCDTATNNVTGVTITVTSSIGVHERQMYCHDCYYRFIEWTNQAPHKLLNGMGDVVGIVDPPT